MCVICLSRGNHSFPNSQGNTTIHGTLWPIGSEPDLPKWAMPTAFGLLLLASSFVFCAPSKNVYCPGWILSTSLTAWIGALLRTFGEHNLDNDGLYYANLYFINLACIMMPFAVWQVMARLNSVILELDTDLKGFGAPCFITGAVTTFAVIFTAASRGYFAFAKAAQCASLMFQIFCALFIMIETTSFQCACSNKKASLPKWKVPFCKRYVLTLLPIFTVMHISWLMLLVRSLSRFIFLTKAFDYQDFFDHPAWSVTYLEELPLFIIPLLWSVVNLQSVLRTCAATVLPTTSSAAVSAPEPPPRYEEVELGRV